MNQLLFALSIILLLLALLIGQYTSLGYFLGLLSGGVHNLFNVFGYVGADCVFINYISNYFIALVFLIGILKVRDKLKT